MKKKMKMKRYEGGGDVYTGDDEIVKYRMGMTDKKEEPKAEAETVSRDFDSTDSETPSMNLPAAKAIPKKTAAKLKPKSAEGFTKAETGGGAALMTRKDRSGMPKAKAKSFSYTPDHTMGMAMKKGGKVKSASARADGCCVKGKTRA